MIGAFGAEALLSGKTGIMAGFERVIVTEVPGTTRDTVEQTVNLGGVLLRLTDSPRLTLRFPADVPYGEVQNGGMIRFTGGRLALHNAMISFAME